MIEGMEAYVGFKLKPEAIERWGQMIRAEHKICTRPDFYSGRTHINMFIYFDDDYRITDFSGTKGYGPTTSIYNRSGSYSSGDFTKRDIAYLRRFVKENTESQL